MEKQHVVMETSLVEEEPAHALVEGAHYDSVMMAAFLDNIGLAAEQQVD